jgi:hypothetical protein
MLPKCFVLFLIISGLTGCSEKKDIVNHGLESFVIEGVDSEHNLKFDLPKTFVNVKEIDDFERIDTTDIALNWILNLQYENPEVYCFYDSSDTRFNVIIKAGPRIDIGNKERSFTYFTVPTVPLSKVFPPESDSIKIVYDSGENKYKDKTYYKRKYQAVSGDGASSEYYYVSTKWHSALIIINSQER